MKAFLGFSKETVTTCEENTVHRLSCDLDSVIKVETALYGREDNVTCSEGKSPTEVSITDCSLVGAADVVKKRCNGRKVCELSTEVFGGSVPCRGTAKYLKTTYTCLPAFHRVTCEHSLSYLHCDEGQVIVIYGADYGRRDQITCVYERPASEIQNTACYSPTSKVAEREKQLLSSALLLATAGLLMPSVAVTERAITCDDNISIQRLSCEYGVISVQSALYGRTDRQICSEGRSPQQLANTKCSQEGTADLVKSRCDGKTICEFNPGDIRIIDPCNGIDKYLETNYTCVPAIHFVTCEHSYATLHCEHGQVIFVYGADYGRRDHTTCSYRGPASQTENVYCSNPTRKVVEICNGKNSCTIRASNSVFGDPCAGTFKYLEVAYTCEYL
ncbi:L-rhamnose-binding lectin SML-like [Girardinichthys multiradiatus]|uniref:L-rhamnose-binding lectin SML-like n=1 Tax=Girardinichthys multiradiatus TaxID=208333 RepID=UPI001FADB657|nr:L-rhamnose-binding lectin SML-like [Girardinichthys multiradiatus]